MILILANPTDPWATLLHREIKRRHRKVSWIQPAQLLDSVQLNWPAAADPSVISGSVIIDGLTVPLTDLTGVFARLTWPPVLGLEGLSQPDQDYVTKEAIAAWLAFLNALSCPVVNRPIPGGWPTLLAGSPLLSRMAPEHGFGLPPSRCMSSRADALVQFAAWGERVYLKTVGDSEPGMILQAHDGREQICRLLEQQAVSMQSIPHGQRVTMYVVGDQVVGTVVKPDVAHESGGFLSAMPIGQCIRFVHALGLSFAECLMVIGAEGQPWCLDVVGPPNYWTCPREVQQRLVNQLATHLLGETWPSRMEPELKDGRESAMDSMVNAGVPEGD